MLSFARLTQPDFVERARKSGVAELLTIPYSHYCEMGLWSMQLSGQPVVERAYMPGQHVLAVMSLRVGGAMKFLSSTSFVTKAGGRDCARQGRSTQDRKRATAVPALCLPDGRVLRDSWEIVAHSGLLPISAERRALYDAELGPAARQVCVCVCVCLLLRFPLSLTDTNLTHPCLPPSLPPSLPTG